MTAAERSTPDGRAPAVSVLVTTFNRSRVLRRALESILRQDFTDYEIVVVDDASTDDTEAVMTMYQDDPRVRYVRNEENIAGRHGDRAIFERFVAEQARGEFFLWLCDDDYWLPTDLLSRQVRIMRERPTVVMVVGGMAQHYPTAVPLPIPNEPYISYEYVGGARDVIFARNIYPDGFIPSEAFLRLFAEDPKNRNILTGATMFRAASFRAADPLAGGRDVRWQSGYMLLAGTATAGDVWYIDEPCVVAEVELTSASYRGTQLDHMLDCVRAVDASFRRAAQDPDAAKRRRMAALRAQMMHSIIIQTYLANKISYRLGGFRSNLLKGIDRIFVPEITVRQFHGALRRYRVPVSLENRLIIALSAVPPRLLCGIDRWVQSAFRAPPHWWTKFMRFPEGQ